METCSCGASIEVIWTEPSSKYDSKHVEESGQAKVNLAAFRKAHERCRHEREEMKALDERLALLRAASRAMTARGRA